MSQSIIPICDGDKYSFINLNTVWKAPKIYCQYHITQLALVALLTIIFKIFWKPPATYCHYKISIKREVKILQNINGNRQQNKQYWMNVTRNRARSVCFIKIKHNKALTQFSCVTLNLRTFTFGKEMHRIFFSIWMTWRLMYNNFDW